MHDVTKWLGCFGLLVFVVVLVVLVAMNANLFRGIAKRAKVRKSDIRSYAKRYLRKFPDSGRNGLREALRQEFVPERVSGRDTDKELLGCLLFGMIGFIASAVTQATAAKMGDDDIQRIKDIIEDAIKDLLGAEGE